MQNSLRFSWDRPQKGFWKYGDANKRKDERKDSAELAQETKWEYSGERRLFVPSSL